RATFERRRLGLADPGAASLADQLLNGGHYFSVSSVLTALPVIAGSIVQTGIGHRRIHPERVLASCAAPAFSRPRVSPVASVARARRPWQPSAGREGRGQ